MAAKKITIEVMVLYAGKVGSEYADVETDLIAHSIAQANLSFVNSGIGIIKLRLVHRQEIEYDEAGGEHFDHLYRMVDGVGAFTKVRALRDEKRADVFVLIVDDASGCGLATRVAADAEEAFSIVHHACAALMYSVPHEIRHIIGTRHDRWLDQSASPFPYGHSYVNGTKWRMSWEASCNGCPQLPFWSNPTIKIRGEPAGAVDADNARVILKRAERVSRFRLAILDTPPPVGLLSGNRHAPPSRVQKSRCLCVRSLARIGLPEQSRPGARRSRSSSVVGGGTLRNFREALFVGDDDLRPLDLYYIDKFQLTELPADIGPRESQILPEIVL